MCWFVQHRAWMVWEYNSILLALHTAPGPQIVPWPQLRFQPHHAEPFPLSLCPLHPCYSSTITELGRAHQVCQKLCTSPPMLWSPQHSWSIIALTLTRIFNCREVLSAETKTTAKSCWCLQDINIYRYIHLYPLRKKYRQMWTSRLSALQRLILHLKLMTCSKTRRGLAYVLKKF